MRAHFPYLWNGWADYVEIWCAVGDQLARQLIQTNGGVNLRVCTCVPIFRISGAAERIVLKFTIRVERFTSFACDTKSWMGCQYLHVPNLGVHMSIR